ncbi:MAG TPA: cytochrome C oxidase subunit IV family protein [Thermodesulfobacteriota bacterium]|nr:cytochrome C oxidase subunit IV family protein [Thermodesulfobacteriota bacterium]
METRVHEHDEHHVGYKTYIIIFIALIILTAITVYVSYFNFGVFNIVIALVIASLKASLVALWFMHLKFEDKVTWVFVLFPLALLALMIGLVAADVFYRGSPVP